MAMVPPPNDFILRSQYERDLDLIGKRQDRTDKNLDLFVAKVDQLLDVVGVINYRVTNVEEAKKKTADQAFTRTLSVTQLAWGCGSGLVLLFLSTILGIASSLFLSYILHPH